MTTFVIESRACFVPVTTEYTREMNACSAAAEYEEAAGGLFGAWTDGSNWIDHDGTQVGWIEADGSLWPPAAVLALVNA